jgi:hypothetical protein
MLKTGYAGITLGPTDLRLPAGVLTSVVVAGNPPDRPFISANVGLFGFDAEVMARHRVVAAGGKRIAITGVLGKQYQKQINNSEIEMSDPRAALKRIVPKMKQDSDYLVLLANAPVDESIRLAKEFPQFDLVLSAGGPAEPPAQPTMLNDGKTVFVEMGEKGMNAVVLGLFDDPKHPVRYQRVPLDSRFPQSREMRLLMAAYQEQLKQMGFERLGAKPVPHPLHEANGGYVGTKVCGECHEESNKVWRKSAHAEAYATLEKLDPPRNFDPECVSCHVVGWNPGKFFPYCGGYLGPKKTPELENVGCEDCHGPGQRHALAEKGKDVELQKKMQKTVRITKEEAADPRSGKQNCYTCHDGDNSPDFKFETYYPLIEHHEE